MTAPNSCYKCQSGWCQEHNVNDSRSSLPESSASLPEWIENVDAIGTSEFEGTEKLKKALAIAWEALEKLGKGNRYPATLNTVREALHRIEELGK